MRFLPTRNMFWLLSGAGVASLWAPALLAQNNNDSDEIIVTAQKRVERALDVPGALTVVDGGKFDTLGMVGLQDMAAVTPGLIVAGSNRGQSSLIMRGIATTTAAPSSSVGIVVDGLPAGSSSSFALGGSVPLDVNPFDLERVEVLRGPQGTLYGASTLAGLISYVTRQPSLVDTNGAASLSMQAVDGGGFGVTARAAVSTPVVTDRIGLRVSGFYDRQPGFLDNPVIDAKNVNRSRAYGGRASLLVKPVDDLTATLSAQFQNLNRRSSDAVSYDLASGAPLAGARDQLLATREPYHQKFQQYSGKVDWNIGSVTLTSITGWSRIRSSNSFDYSSSPIGSQLIFFGGGAIAGATLPFIARTDKFVTELRLASQADGPFKWLLGGFYTDEDSVLAQSIVGIDARQQPAAPFAPAMNFDIPTSYREYAGFANLSYAITDRIELGGGLRYSNNRQHFAETISGPLADMQGVAGTFPTVRSSEDVFTYSASVKYALDEDSNLYARASSGYRPGGPNLVLPGIARTFESDTLDNYELGFKSGFLDGRASIDLALFHIDYHDAQLTGSLGGLLYFTNAKGATSNGAELSASVQPLDGLIVAGNLAYTDATLDQAVPELGARDGERLPGTPRFAGAITADYRRPLSADVDGVAGATLRYLGRRPSSFDASLASPQLDLASAILIDLRAGIEWAGYSIDLQIRNLTNEAAEVFATTTYGKANVSIMQPRSFGLSLSKMF